MGGKVNKDDRDRFMQALEARQRPGAAPVCCDVCETPIRFRDQGAATIHECDCGKFNGSLRGL